MANFLDVYELYVDANRLSGSGYTDFTAFKLDAVDAAHGAGD